jgi:hypothetical protein
MINTDTYVFGVTFAVFPIVQSQAIKTGKEPPSQLINIDNIGQTKSDRKITKT